MRASRTRISMRSWSRFCTCQTWASVRRDGVLRVFLGEQEEWKYHWADRRDIFDCHCFVFTGCCNSDNLRGSIDWRNRQVQQTPPLTEDPVIQ